MTAHTHDLPIAFWENNLEELDGEIARLAMLCGPGSLNPAPFSGADNATSRVRNGESASPSPSCARFDDALLDTRKVGRRLWTGDDGAVEDYVIDRLKQRFPHTQRRVAARLRRPGPSNGCDPDRRHGGSAGIAGGRAPQPRDGVAHAENHHQARTGPAGVTQAEALYGEFIAECSKLLVDAMSPYPGQAGNLAERLRAAQPHPAVRLTAGTHRRRAAAAVASPISTSPRT